MSYYDWHVGMKVVCLSAPSRNLLYHLPEEKLPTEGLTYTIREIGCWNPLYPDYVTVRLMEIINRPTFRIEIGAELETFFYAQDYRPLTKRKTDISIFEAMLTGAKEREPA